MGAVARRTLRVAALVLPLAAALLALPAVTDAGTCPADATGVLEKATYRLGDRLDFYGIYTDFADPGTVTITFTRPADGATRTFTAGNVADGSWMQTVVFSSRADLGTWRVHVDVVQTSGTSACDDRFTLLGTKPQPIPTPPNTATADDVAPSSPDATLPFVLVLVGLIAFLVALWVPRVRR